jgi:hypothetical protein
MQEEARDNGGSRLELAVVDVLFLLAIFCGIMAPAVLLTRRARPGTASMGH